MFPINMTSQNIRKALKDFGSVRFPSNNPKQNILLKKITGRIRSCGILRIFTVVILLCLGPAKGSKPTGHSLSLS